MKKVILNQEVLYYDFVNCPKGYEIDRHQIRHEMMWGYLNSKKEHPTLTQYPMRHCLSFDYLGEYIRDFLGQFVEHQFKLVFKQRFGYILKQDEYVASRNDIDILDIKASPVYTLVYGVELEDHSSNLIIHHNIKKTPNCTWSIPMQNNKFIIFPSHLNYEITSNNSKLNSFYLIQTYDEVIYGNKGA